MKERDILFANDKKNNIQNKIYTENAPPNNIKENIKKTIEQDLLQVGINIIELMNLQNKRKRCLK